MDTHDITHHYRRKIDSIFQRLHYDGTIDPIDHLYLLKNILRHKNITNEDDIIANFFNIL